MIFSRTAEYVIRAFVNLALQPKGRFALARHIAEDAKIPAIHFGKTLQPFVRNGLLRSRKGPTGGFALRRSPSEIRLIDIVEPIDGILDYQRCPAGLTGCSDDLPCSIHDNWTHLRVAILKFLEEITVSDLAKALDAKRKSITKGATSRALRTTGARDGGKRSKSLRRPSQ